MEFDIVKLYSKCCASNCLIFIHQSLSTRLKNYWLNCTKPAYKHKQKDMKIIFLETGTTSIIEQSFREHFELLDLQPTTTSAPICLSSCQKKSGSESISLAHRTLSSTLNVFPFTCSSCLCVHQAIPCSCISVLRLSKECVCVNEQNDGNEISFNNDLQREI